MMMSFAEYERSNVAEKTRAKLLAQARRGMWGGGHIPYGYDYQRERQQLIPHPVESVVLRRIFLRASELISLGQIAKELTDEKIMTGVRWERQGHERRKIGARPFRTEVLRKLIQNPLYRGAIRHGGDEYPGQHEALVSSEIWEQANAAITEATRSPTVSVRPQDRHSNLLKGLLVCAACRQPLLAKASGKDAAAGPRYRYYVCRGPRPGSDSALKCHLGNLPAKPLEELVVAFLGNISRQDATHERIDRFARNLQPEGSQLTIELEGLERSLLAIQERIRNCTEVVAMRGLETLSPELVEKAKQLTQDRRPLLVRREDLRRRLRLLHNGPVDLARLHEAFGRLDRVLVGLSRPELRELLRTMLESVEIKAIESGNRTRLARAGDRILRLTIAIRTEAMMTAMERGIEPPQTVEDRRGRILNLEMEAVVGRRNRIRITAPFHVDLDPSPKRQAATRKTGQHAIHRATVWSNQLVAGNGVREIARANGISPSLVSIHLKLLRLAPQIQKFLRDTRSQTAINRYSLRKMATLAALSPEAQMEAFAWLQKDGGRGVGPELEPSI